MYVHRQDFLLYSPFYDVYKDKCICLNAYFFGFRRSNNTPGRAHKLNTARIYLFIYFDVYLNETFFYRRIKVILLYIFVMDMIE